MAKRYKEKERKKRQKSEQAHKKREHKEVVNKNIKSKSKKENLKFIIIFMIILVVIVVVVIGINKKWFNSNISKEEKEVTAKEEKETDRIIKEISDKAEQQSIVLENNLLNPEELTNEIVSKLNMMSEAEIHVIQIHYRLKSLDRGTIDIYYKINNIDLIKINVNIDEKKIENIEEYNDANLLEKEVIGDNLKEDVEEDFESREDGLDIENRSVNIIITNTEVVINTGMD